MWVVKLGGSLLGEPALKHWLRMLVSQGDGRVIIVPGGGVFADAVREAQATAGYDDAAAHRMAVLAMDQYALAMKSLEPELVTASSELEIAERSWQHRAILWMPSLMVLADETIPMSWSVTSDSLAAWLARKLDADRLVLVKHRGIEERPLPLSQLVRDEVLDAAFAEFASTLTCPIDLLGIEDIATFDQLLSDAPAPARAN